MRRTGAYLRKQHDTCSCWACRDSKYREKRKTVKQKAMIQELKDHLENTSPIQLKKEWDEVKEFSDVGIAARDFLKSRKYFQTQLSQNQSDLEPEFQEIVNKEFWNMI